MSQHFHVKNIQDWSEVAQYLIQSLRAPQLLTLSGPLGAGKTTLVQALAHELGIKAEPRSPTFSLLRSYALPEERNGIRRLVHVDAYRLETANDVYALDLEGELAEPGTIIAIEWPEQLGEALQKFHVPQVCVVIDPQATNDRLVEVS